MTTKTTKTTKSTTTSTPKASKAKTAKSAPSTVSAVPPTASTDAPATETPATDVVPVEAAAPAKTKKQIAAEARATARAAKSAQMQPRECYVSDRDYFLATGKLPNGMTTWAFDAHGDHLTGDQLLAMNRDRDAYRFTYRGRFGKAKQVAKAHYAKLGIKSVDVVVPAVEAPATPVAETGDAASA